MSTHQPEAQIRWKAIYRLLRVRLRKLHEDFPESEEAKRISNDICSEGTTGNTKGGLFDMLK